MRWALKSGRRQFAIRTDIVVLGRGQTADVQLDDDSVSRRHASVRIEDDRLVLEDLRSRNGTFVNGRPILGRARLSPGDRILLGLCELELVRAPSTSGLDPERITEPLPRMPHTSGALASLSPREREVFVLLARGLSQRAIASQLSLSVKTLETYRTRIGQKLGLKNRAQLIRCALETGILRASEN